MALAKLHQFYPVLTTSCLLVNLAFAWTQSPNSPLILRQANFLFEFDVCFSRSRSEFEVRPGVFE
jgi:hypothetical protein